MLQAVLDFINVFLTMVWNVLTWVFSALYDLNMAIFQLLFDGFLTIVYGLVSSLSLTSLLVDVAASWGLLDTNSAYLISVSGLPEGLSLIGVAYVIRLLLNLIPSVVTRI
jgi:hypothetical protein